MSVSINIYPPLPIPLLWFIYVFIYLFVSLFFVVVYIVNLCLRLLKISWTPVFYFFMFFSGTIFETFFFHYLWTVMKILKLSKWSTVYWIPYIHKKYINYLCIVRLIALWVIVISAWNSSGCSVNINGGCPHVHMELTVRVREWSEYIMYASGFMFNMTSSDTCIVYL